MFFENVALTRKDEEHAIFSFPHIAKMRIQYEQIINFTVFETFFIALRDTFFNILKQIEN